MLDHLRHVGRVGVGQRDRVDLLLGLDALDVQLLEHLLDELHLLVGGVDEQPVEHGVGLDAELHAHPAPAAALAGLHRDEL